MRLCSSILLAVCTLTAIPAYAQPVRPAGAAAATRPGIVATPPAATAAVAPVAVSGSDANYTLGIADVVRLMVYNEPDLTGEFTIGDSGILSLPLIGSVPAAGHTVSALTDEIVRRFADGYLRDPKVSLEVLTYRPFYILGEVQKPGQYPYSNGLTVMNAVATASGFTYSASKHHVFIKRAGQSAEQDVKLTDDLVVHPGDTIRIGVRHF